MAEPLRDSGGLPPNLAGGRLRHVAETASVNDLALACRDDGAVFLADRQTAGRGRRGAAWESGAPLGLWCSLTVAGPPRGLSMAAALAVRDAVAPSARLTVKWPNDLRLSGRKCCGILVEHRNGWNAVGIGLNLYHGAADFPPALRDHATSLRLATGRAPARLALLGRLVAEWDRWLGVLAAAEGHESVRAAWAAACALVGRRIIRDGVSGLVREMDGEGALLVETAEGLRRIDHGAVEVLAEDESCYS